MRAAVGGGSSGGTVGLSPRAPNPTARLSSRIVHLPPRHPCSVVGPRHTISTYQKSGRHRRSLPKPRPDGSMTRSSRSPGVPSPIHLPSAASTQASSRTRPRCTRRKGARSRRARALAPAVSHRVAALRRETSLDGAHQLAILKAADGACRDLDALAYETLERACLGDDAITRYRDDAHRNGLPVWAVMVQPEVSAVATNPVSTTFPPSSSVERTFHLPATSASEIVADAAGVSGAAAAVSIAVWSSAARSSDLVQPTRTAAQQKKGEAWHHTLPC